MKIVAANYNDAEELSVFATKAFYDAYDWYNTPENMRNYVNNHFNITTLTQEINNPNTIYLLAKNENEKIIGYAKIGIQNSLASLIKESHSEIERLYVDIHQQRLGLGLLLINEIKRISIKRNNKYLWLGVWKKNEKAIHFYLKNGFEIFGNTTFLLGDDLQEDHLMRLYLNS
jgi:ribosomal protein S18 acetylase RimI-like enzyme